MKYFQPLAVERFIHALINNDREFLRFLSSWEMEKDEVCKLLNGHFIDLGLYTVFAMEHADLVRKEITHLLNHSTEIRKRREVIQRQIAAAREKSKARGLT